MPGNPTPRGKDGSKNMAHMLLSATFAPTREIQRMRLFIPAGGSQKKGKLVKSGARRERRKTARQANAREIDRMIEERKNKGLGLAT
jgi:hypothetical protein